MLGTRKRTPRFALIVFLIIATPGCKKEPPLPEFEILEARGTIEIVEAAQPEGGATASFAVSDMSRPPQAGDIGWWPSVAVDSHGQVHISYTDAYNGAIHHAQKLDDQWVVSPVDSYGPVGKYTALSISEGDIPHVVYYNQDNKVLRHAARVGAEHIDPERRGRPRRALDDWLYEVVDQGHEIGMAGRLVVDRKGVVHAVYYGTNQRLVHAWREPTEPGERGRWQRRMIDREAGGSYSIVIGMALGSDGSLHVSYFNWVLTTTDLKYAVLEPGSDEWRVRDVESPNSPGWKSGITLDEDNRPIIAYLTSQRRQIWIARLEGDKWIHSPLAGNANTLALTRIENGPLLIAYEHLPGPGLRGATVRYMLRDNSLGDLQEGWTIYTVPGSSIATYLAATLHPSGEPVIAFYRGDIRGISIFDGRANKD